MERRLVDLKRDYSTLAAMQRTSWEVNFPGEPYLEGAFRYALERSAPSGAVFVYVQDEELVAWLWLDWRVGRERAHIRHLQVAESCWGRGYGRQLVGDACALALEKGKREITLNVTKSNERAMRLYTGNGFVTKHDMGDRLHMGRKLSSEQE